ncbi:MAG: NADH-quinone oxidoreductase subunit N [Thermodesulfobacteriota bacterium]
MIDAPKTIELIQLWPVLALVATIGLILLCALLIRGKSANRVQLLITAFGLITAIISTIQLLPMARTLKAAPVSGDPPAGSLLSGSIIFDPLFLFMIAFLGVLLLLVMILSDTLWQKDPWEWPIFWSLLLGSLTGMILMAATYHLIFFVIAFELVSLPSYVLVGFRRFSVKSVEGSAKYIIFGAVCSVVMLYGISLLYGLTGSFQFEKIAPALADGGFQVTEVVALLCLLIGFGFKISLAPMHFWTPDAFEAAGADIAAWLGVASKSAALIALGRFVMLLTTTGESDFNHVIILTLTVLAVLTMTVANLSAYWQKSVKRLLAYSSIAHAGYMVCGIAVSPVPEGMAAVIAYIVVYMLMNFGAFAVTGLIEKQTGSDDIESFSGLGSRCPKLSILMMIFLFSLVGLPPLAGFAVKWILISVLWQNNATLLVVAILINTLFSLYYYMRLARAMYFENTQLPAVTVPAPITALLVLCAGGLFALFVGWGVLNSFSIHLIRTVWN